MKLLGILFLLLSLTGCSTFALDQLQAEGAAASAVCLVGSGPPMTGGGTVTGAKVNDGFKGSVRVAPDCAMEIISQ